MQIKMPRMGTGVPNAFSGPPLAWRKPAGRTQMLGSNIKLAANETKKLVDKGMATAAKFARTGKG